MNALIAYYTWSGNTRKLAERIGEETGGTLFAIRPVKPYSGSYNTCLEEAKKDIRKGHRPELLELPADLSGYDTVFVGTPNWWSTIAPPVASFLHGLDLSGKTVVPFCTHGGGGQARCASDIAELCLDARMLEGMAVCGSASRSDVSRWLAEIGLN